MSFNQEPIHTSTVKIKKTCKLYGYTSYTIGWGNILR